MKQITSPRGEVKSKVRENEGKKATSQFPRFPRQEDAKPKTKKGEEEEEEEEDGQNHGPRHAIHAKKR